jgi:hypothetical protein
VTVTMRVHSGASDSESGLPFLFFGKGNGVILSDQLIVFTISSHI